MRQNKAGRWFDEAAWIRQGQKRSDSRAACWECGLRESATIHGSDAWWQHRFVPAILTKAR